MSRISPHKQTEILLQSLSGRAHVSLLGRAAAGIWATFRARGFAQRIILVPANSCYIVLWAVLESGNIPLLVDIDPLTGNISRQTLQQTGVEDAAAVIPCHMYGLPAPMDEITAWAHERGIFVIEDAALALGGQVAGRPAGAWGNAAIFSFGLGKVVDNQVGGALGTDDKSLATEIDHLLSHVPLWDDTMLELTNQWNNLYWALHQYEDRNPRLLALYPQLFDTYRPLITYRLAADEWRDFPAALHHLDQNLEHRNRIADGYDQQLQPLPVRTMKRPTGAFFWRYPFFVAPKLRNALLQHLWEHGIHEATRWYPSLRYMASALVADVAQPPTPNADLLSASVINLPVDGSTNATAVEKIARLIGAFFEDQN